MNSRHTKTALVTGANHGIARAVAFLVSEDASWITGQVIAVDGGHSLGRRF